MALYEAVFIARQDLTTENVDSISEKLSAIITDRKGKVVATEYWGLRTLAYKINKNPRGHYVSLSIESENEGIEEFRRVAGLNEDIIRSNIFQVEEHSKDPSALMVSDTAKNFKPTEAGKAKKSDERIALDVQIDKIVINS
jgi:small subunit ribosomal protein S6